MLNDLPEWVYEFADVADAVDELRNADLHRILLNEFDLLDHALEPITYSIRWQTDEEEGYERVEFQLMPHRLRRPLAFPVPASELSWKDVNEKWEVALVDSEVVADEKFDPPVDPISHQAPRVGDMLYRRKGTSTCLTQATVQSFHPFPDGTETTQASFVDLAM